MKSGNRAHISGFVVAAEEGQPFWFLNTLTINKVGSQDTQGQLSIADHRVPPASRRRPASMRQATKRCSFWTASSTGSAVTGRGAPGPARWCSCRERSPHGFTVSPAAPGRIIVVVSPGGFDQFVAAADESAPDLRLPDPIPPDPALLTGDHLLISGPKNWR
jgi:hypothetical protein